MTDFQDKLAVVFGGGRGIGGAIAVELARRGAQVALSYHGSNPDKVIAAIEDLARRHNALRVTATVDATVRLFHARPFRVLGSSRFVEACLERVGDAWLRSLPLIGGVDQISDSTDVLEDRNVFAAVAPFYG